MGHPRRRFVHNEVYFVTNRLAEGLPFVPNKFMNLLIEGILARAQTRNPEVVLCTFDMLQNHYHAVVMLDGEPSALSTFFHDINDELARLVCKLLGKRNVKVWAQRFHAAKLGDPKAVVKKISYALVNPVAAGFCQSASQWFGVSSWKSLFSPNTKPRYWYRSKNLRALPDVSFTKFSVKQNLRYLSEIESECTRFNYKLNPFRWKICFKETKNITDNVIRDLILTEARTEERAILGRMTKENRTFANKNTLQLQNPHKYHKPKTFGRRVYCICTCPELRAQLIKEYQGFCETCRKIWKQWLTGIQDRDFPPGAFIPPRTPRANLLPTFV